MNPLNNLDGFKYEAKPKRIMGLDLNNFYTMATLGHAVTIKIKHMILQTIAMLWASLCHVVA